uniref:Neprosin PEP catalytic domain-containing protein n=1 Tax=Solanum tuberosum TaxID=4113 RepID=M1CY65_SOLTU
MYGSSGYKVAIARTKNYPDNKFSGAGMAASIWNPPVKDGQHSACRLKIQKGSDILQVDPTLYGDNKARLFIHFQDQANGNWWLFMEENHIQIGFWPQRIFTKLTSFATNVEWGGVVYSPPGVPKPPMGSNFFPVLDSDYDAYCRAITVTNDKGETMNPTETTTFVNNPDMYFVFDVHNFKHHHFVLYGGPGDQIQV